MLAQSQPEAGHHHDLYDVEQHLTQLVYDFEKLGLEVKGLFMNADAGFDSQRVRQFCKDHEIEANIAFNQRNSLSIDRDDYFDPELYKARSVIEHSFAWLDGFKNVLVRFETKAQHWFTWLQIASLVIFARKIHAKTKL